MGRPPGSSEKPWRDAIRLAVNRYVEGEGDKKQLARLAETLVAKACDGDVTALKEIGDRLDGKPAQTIAGDAENPLEHVMRWAKESEVSGGD